MGKRRRNLFQSTHSLRSATIPGTGCGRSWPVSIHALLAECDASYLRWRQLGPGFNPRTPCGVRPRLARTTATDKRFQSTHSLRSATPCSIPCLTSWMSFQSTHSLRSATQTEARTRTMLKVSIHALVRVRPHYPGIRLSSGSFNPRTRESATGPYPTRFSSRGVSIHALVRVRLLNVYGLIINSATGVLRQPPMGGTKIPGREKEMIVVKIRTPTDYENRRCPGNFL